MSIFEKRPLTFVKNVILLHKLKLTSADFLLIFYFVTINFYYLILKVFRRFFIFPYNIKMEIKNLQKISKNFICEFCDFKCCRKSEWDIHITRPKHFRNKNGKIMEKMENIKISTHICACKKEFKTSSGLWKHKKKCIT